MKKKKMGRPKGKNYWLCCEGKDSAKIAHFYNLVSAKAVNGQKNGRGRSLL